jgi:hypothetical protein
MAKVSASELERVISAARNRRVWDFRNRIRPESSEVLANERKLGERIRAFLTKAGIEVEEIDKMLADNQTERRRLLEKEKADAQKLLPRIEDTFRHGIDARIKALELANSSNIKPPTFIVLDTPFSILAHPSNVLTASHIEPRNSTAKMFYDRGQEGDVSEDVWVSFYFRWENSSPNPVLLENVVAHLVVNGYWEVEANSSLLDYNYSQVVVAAELLIFELWNQAPPPLVESNRISELDVRGGFPGPWGSKGKTRYEIIVNGYDVVEYNSFAVPPEGVVIFEVRLNTSVLIEGMGSVATGWDRDTPTSVVCPFVQFKASELVRKGPPL